MASENGLTIYYTMKTKTEGKQCDLCGREVRTTKHHLIPRAVHSKQRYINRFGKAEMRTRSLQLCKLCHGGLHDIFTEKQLGWTYNTKESLLSDPRVQKHVQWARKQKT
jgi:hypothetical protein